MNPGLKSGTIEGMDHWFVGEMYQKKPTSMEQNENIEAYPNMPHLV